ncbi:MAG: RidA family protein [Candidatus Aminicenantales bacterium]
MKSKIMTPLFIISFLFLLCLAGNSLSLQDTSSKKIIFLTEKPVNLPFSPAILVKDTLFISGQLAVDPVSGEFLGGTMTEQAERIIKNIEILLKKAGMDLSHVVKTTVFISDFNEFGEFNAVFRKMFPQDPPTRATVQVAKLARGAKIEISAMAIK